MIYQKKNNITLLYNPSLNVLTYPHSESLRINHSAAGQSINAQLRHPMDSERTLSENKFSKIAF